MEQKDRTGQKYNLLTFIKSTDKKIGKNKKKWVWELLCDCGNTTYALSESVVSGNTTSCGCAQAQKRIDQGLRNRKYNPMISSARAVWQRSYKDCDFDTFLSLSQEKCYYCGRDPHRTFNMASQRKRSIEQIKNGNFTYNGLDRVDSNKGHTPDNIVPCCTDCNKAKLTMTKEDFLSLIKLIHDRHF
jgi:hypothetical protein